MNSQKLKKLSISNLTSISIFPTHEVYSNTTHSDFVHFILDENTSEVKIPELLEKLPETDEEYVETKELYCVTEEDPPSIKNESTVFCMNCLETIELERIDSHSIVCDKPIEEYSEITLKLNKFLNWVREFKMDCKEIYSYPLIVLEEVTKKIILSKSEIPACFEKINLAFKEFHKLPVILLAFQRLATLVEALLRQESMSFESFPVIQIEILDEVIKSSNVQDSLTSFRSDLSADMSRQGVGDIPESKERFFYSQYMKIKRNLKASSLISMFELYEQCDNQKIPIEGWGSFIESNMVINN